MSSADQHPPDRRDEAIASGSFGRAAAVATARFTRRLHLDELPQMVADSLVDDFGGALARIWLHDPATDLLRLCASAGVATEPDATGLDLTAYPYLVPFVTGSEEPWVRNDATAIEEFEQPALPRAGCCAVVALPLLIAGEFQGVVSYFSMQRLSDEQVRSLATFTTMVSALLGQRRLLHAARRAERSKDESLALLDTLFATAPVGLAFFDTSLRTVRVNDATTSIYGVSVEACLGRRPSDILAPYGEDAELLMAHVLRTGESLTDMATAGGPDRSGRARQWVANYYPVRSRDGEIWGVGATFTEAAATAGGHEGRPDPDSELRMLVEGMAGYAIFLLDPDGRVMTWNSGAERITGWRAEEIIGRLAGTLFPPEEAAHGAPERRLEEAIASGRSETQGWRMRKDGSRFWADTVIAALHRDDGFLYGFSVVTRDITERHGDEQRLRHQALHDALTGLPNRVLLQDRLEQAVRDGRRYGRRCVLLLLDLDRFKHINDTFGHHTGDTVLRQVAERLQAALRTSDTVARLGGDEFAVLLPEVAGTADGSVLARKLLTSLEQPILVADEHFDVEASIGVAGFPEHAGDASALLRRADAAMYEAKRMGTGYMLYTDNRSPERFPRVARHDELRHAIDGGELILDYQPVMQLRTGRVSSLEALVRWRHPQRGLLAPSEFVPLARRTGLMQPLTRWVLDTGLRQCRAWLDEGRAYTVSVNVSIRSLDARELVDTVGQALARSGVPARQLQLEISEDEILADPDAAATVIEPLAAEGVTFAIDDFGSASSSLTSLKRLPVHELKVDPSFVEDLVTDPWDASIVRSIVELGHNLAMRVVAEGVEGPRTRDLLLELGCDYAQGFLLRRPGPADEAVAAFVSTNGQAS